MLLLQTDIMEKNALSTEKHSADLSWLFDLSFFFFYLNIFLLAIFKNQNI